MLQLCKQITEVFTMIIAKESPFLLMQWSRLHPFYRMSAKESFKDRCKTMNAFCSRSTCSKFWYKNMLKFVLLVIIHVA